MANLGELLPGLDHEQVVQALCDAFFAHHGEVVPPEHISPSGCPTCPALPRLLPANAAGSGTSAMLPPSATCWRSVSLGRGRASFRRGEGVIGRAQIFSDTLDPAPLDDLAARLPGWPIVPTPSTSLRQWRATFSANPELEGFSAWLLTALR